jgi:2-amino-4-hydroxy-6-hydroxymethyldihydropteridine diphosphokinase
MANITAYIGLGSNLGNRNEAINGAITALASHAHIQVCKISSFMETSPEGGPSGQTSYLNAALALQTDLSPDQLLAFMHQIEHDQGRERVMKNGPRPIDLDLLFYGDFVLQETSLTIPHPRLNTRSFVLEPLAEIAPDYVHPVLGLSVQALRDRLRWLTIAGNSTGRELVGKRALVTGSTSGIGKAIALEMATAGADVIVHGRRSEEAATKVSREVEQRGCRSHVLMADLRISKHLPQFVADAWSLWQGVDIWINNAGSDTLTGEAASWSFEQKLADLLAVDLTATVVLSRSAGERMVAAGEGVILTMGWDRAATGMEGDSGQLFGAVKGAVMAFTKSLAMTLAPKVRVNCLAPGWIQTAWGKGASKAWHERVMGETPLKRWGTPEDVAAAARWLVSPRASYITGQIVNVNGGAVR